MTNTAEFQAPLARFVQIDFEGHPTFSYSSLSGHLIAVVEIAEERLSRTLGYRGKDRDREVREVLGYLRERIAEQDLISQQWGAHLEERRAARAARPIGEIAARVLDRIPNPSGEGPACGQTAGATERKANQRQESNQSDSILLNLRDAGGSHELPATGVKP